MTGFLLLHSITPLAPIERAEWSDSGVCGVTPWSDLKATWSNGVIRTPDTKENTMTEHPDSALAGELHVEDDGTIVQVVDPTGRDCGCIIRSYPDGSWTDSGCFRHMPHHSGEAGDDDR
jgi:hypothetical protein